MFEFLDIVPLARQPSKGTVDASTVPVGCPAADVPPAVLSHLLDALQHGSHSDITIHAFGLEYPLHRLVLVQSGFFRSAIAFEGNDAAAIEVSGPGFTQNAFELCVALLYGFRNESLLRSHAIEVMVMAQYLDMPALVEDCIDWVVADMTLPDVGDLLRFSQLHHYSRLKETCMALLAMNGWEAGVELWCDVPVEVAASVVRSNWFFVPSEWDRCIFLLELIDMHDGDKTLCAVLNEDIAFCHFSHEQLLTLSSMTHWIDPGTLKSALWKSVQLHHYIVSAKHFHGSRIWHIPAKDETLSGLVPELQADNLPTTTIPPFRFSVGFANVSELPPNKRIYSRTFWYLGSWWNVYLQKSQVATTGQFQIGIYLHRANGVVDGGIGESPVTGFNCGANGSKNGVQNVETYRQRPTNEANVKDKNVSDDVDALAAADKLSNLELNDTPKSGTIGQPPAPYTDPRNELNVYFSFYTPSRTHKPEITSFFSVPNTFSLNQSWGWKSNNLCQFTPQGRFLPGDPDILKFSVVLGQ